MSDTEELSWMSYLLGYLAFGAVLLAAKFAAKFAAVEVVQRLYRRRVLRV
jgi:hypothetical protein